MENFKEDDILYHNTGQFEWVIVYSKREDDVIEGKEYINLYSNSKGVDYKNTGVTELRIATEKEREKLFKQFPNIKKIVMGKTITSEYAQEIIEAACPDWSEKLASKWSMNIVLKRDVTISEEFYREMRRACTPNQNILFDKIFGIDNPYKVGDWVFVGDETTVWNSVVELVKIEGDKYYALNKEGKKDFVSQSYVKRIATEEEINKVKYLPEGTLCLVRGSVNDGWDLRYANGKGQFYLHGKKTGIAQSKTYFQKLDINNLPVN